MVPSAPAANPRPGDVVVRRANDGSRLYTLSTYGGVPQLTWTTREEAAAQAARLARTHHVDAWQTEDGRTYTRIVEAGLATSA